MNHIYVVYLQHAHHFERKTSLLDIVACLPLVIISWLYYIE